MKLIGANKQLLEQVPPLGENQVARFILKQKNNSTSIPAICIVQGVNKALMDLKLVDGTRILPNGEKEDVLTRILFGGTGVISIPGNRPDLRPLYQFLYLAPWNETAKGKKFHLGVPQGSEFKYFFQQPAKTAEEKMAFRQRVHEAESIVMKWSSEELKSIFAGLFPKTNMETRSEDELRVKIIEQFAQKKPEYILGLDKKSPVRTKGLVVEAKKMGIIAEEGSHSKWVFADNPSQSICGFIPGKDNLDVLVDFLRSEQGREAESAIKKMLQAPKKKKAPVA